MPDTHLFLALSSHWPLTNADSSLNFAQKYLSNILLVISLVQCELQTLTFPSQKQFSQGPVLVLCSCVLFMTLFFQTLTPPHAIYLEHLITC